MDYTSPTDLSEEFQKNGCSNQYLLEKLVLDSSKMTQETCEIETLSLRERKIRLEFILAVSNFSQNVILVWRKENVVEKHYSAYLQI